MYTQSNGPRSSIDTIDEPACKLIGSGRMTLNKQLLAGLRLKAGDDVVVFFDPALGHIGLRAPHAGDPAGGKLLLSTGTKASSPNIPPGFSLTGFAKSFEIDLKKAAGIFRLEHDRRSGLWVFALPKGSWTKKADAR